MANIALIGHEHSCPLHVGGPILTGDATLTVNGIPAALVGDTCTCMGGSDTIVSGTSKLTVNGKQAALVGSKTAHGGTIIEGDSLLTVR